MVDSKEKDKFDLGVKGFSILLAFSLSFFFEGWGGGDWYSIVLSLKLAYWCDISISKNKVRSNDCVETPSKANLNN